MHATRVINRGSSGIAPFATALGVKNAGCHTPPAVLVRGGSTLQGMGVVSRADRGGLRVFGGLSLRFPHPYEYIVPQYTEKVNPFLKIFLVI